VGDLQHDEIARLREEIERLTAELEPLRTERDALIAENEEIMRHVGEAHDRLRRAMKDACDPVDGLRCETERIIDAGSLPQHLADAENPLRWFHEWHDDDGAVLWFFCPVTEPPFHVGTPFDSDWPWERGREPQQELIWCQLPKLTVDRPAGRGDHHG
jgi:hypothetical protein